MTKEEQHAHNMKIDPTTAGKIREASETIRNNPDAVYQGKPSLVRQLCDASAQADAAEKAKEAALAELANLKAKQTAFDAKVKAMTSSAPAPKTAAEWNAEHDALRNNPRAQEAFRNAHRRELGLDSRAPAAKTQAEWNRIHDAIKDPKAREAFRNSHKRELGLS